MSVEGCARKLFSWYSSSEVGDLDRAAAEIETAEELFGLPDDSSSLGSIYVGGEEGEATVGVGMTERKLDE